MKAAYGWLSLIGLIFIAIAGYIWILT